MSLNDFENKITSHRHLHSFCIHPHMKFEDQYEDENIMLLLRAHPITLVPRIATAVVLFFLPIGLNIISLRFFQIKETILFNIFWYSAIFSYVFINILTWLYNVGIVTNYRVVNIDYHMILHKEVAGSTIEDVIDVTAKTIGFVHSFFHFGDVFVQTAGQEQNIEFLKVPNSREVVSIINRLMRPKNF